MSQVKTELCKLELNFDFELQWVGHMANLNLIELLVRFSFIMTFCRFTSHSQRLIFCSLLDSLLVPMEVFS